MLHYSTVPSKRTTLQEKRLTTTGIPEPAESLRRGCQKHAGLHMQENTTLPHLGPVAYHTPTGYISGLNPCKFLILSNKNIPQ